MDMNLGRYALIMGHDGRWLIMRNNEPFNASYGTREEAEKALRIYLHTRIEAVISRLY